MTSFESSALPSAVLELLNSQAISQRLPTLIGALLDGVQAIGENLRNASYSSQAIGSTNTFGDAQLDVDVKTDALIFGQLQATKLVYIASSEENPVDVDCAGEGFSVAFDPLNGSSIIDANFAVGSIIGIFGGRGFVNRTGRDQVASIIAQYGPRITVILSLNTQATSDNRMHAMELTYAPSLGWFVSIPELSIAPTTKTFAPGNLRATGDNPQYRALVDYWINSKYTLRYSGGLVPDVYHIFIKKGGILANASSKSAKAKLRLLYECAPIALAVEAAGGMTCVCPSEAGEAMTPISLLDVTIAELDQRVGVIYGSREEVERCKAYLFPWREYY